MALPVKPVYDMGKNRKKILPIVIISINALTRITTAGDVIDGLRELNTQRSRHGTMLPDQMCDCKT
jgi:hypothetical protein